jgi:hypothetical protein
MKPIKERKMREAPLGCNPQEYDLERKKSKNVGSLYSRAVLLLGVFCAFSATAAPEEGASRGRSESGVFPRVRDVRDQSEFRPHAGVMLGVADRNGSSSQDASFTLDVGFQPVVPFGYSVQIQHTPGDRPVPGGRSKFNTTNFLMKGVYHLGGGTSVLRHSYFGVKTGVVLSAMEGDNDLNFAVGPALGFDIPVDRSNRFTLGTEFAYLGVLGDASPDQVSLLGAVKYWF